MLRIRNAKPDGAVPNGQNSFSTVTQALCSASCNDSGAQNLSNLVCLQNAASTSCPQTSNEAIATATCGVSVSLLAQGKACTTVQAAVCVDPTSGTQFACDNPPASTTAASTQSTITSTASAGASVAKSASTSPTDTLSSAAVTSTGGVAVPGPAISTHKSTGITGGAAAGIAIGCLIAGAAFAALIFFFLFQRYKKRQQQHVVSTDYMRHLGPAAAPPPAEKAIAATAAVSPIDTYLPQPAEDDAISGELSRIRDNIKNHAQNFYHTAAVDPVMVDESELQDVARATGIRSTALCDRLLNPQTRISTIRLFLGYVILSRCGGHGGARASLLPSEVGLFVDSLTGIDLSNGGKALLKSKWHAISASLLSPRYSNSTFGDSDSRNPSIAATITAIDSVLRPFVSPHQDGAQRLRNLQGVVQRAASFAFLLFSQPSSFSFQWSAIGKLAVFPALLQTSDENGHVLSPSRVLVDMEAL